MFVQRTGLLSLVLVVTSLATSAMAVADQPSDFGAANELIARGHFARGAALYDASRYEDALREFEAARRIDPIPAFDYNIGRCLDRLGRAAEATAAYERYLRAAPDSSNAAMVRERIAALAPYVVALSARPTTPATTSRRLRWLAPGLVAGGALALVAAGAGLLGSAASEYRHLEAACAPRCLEGQWAGLPAREHAGEALLGVAGAVVLLDVVLFVIAARHR